MAPPPRARPRSDLSKDGLQTPMSWFDPRNKSEGGQAHRRVGADRHGATKKGAIGMAPLSILQKPGLADVEDLKNHGATAAPSSSSSPSAATAALAIPAAGFLLGMGGRGAGGHCDA